MLNDQKVNDYILKEIRVEWQCIIVCVIMCLWAYVSLRMHICVPAINKQMPVFPVLPCQAFPSVSWFSMLSLCQNLFYHLTGFSCSRISLFRIWTHFVSALILINWLHKVLRQQTLSSIINGQIHSLLFIWGVWSFPSNEQMSPGLRGNCPPKCKLNTYNDIVNKKLISNSVPVCILAYSWMFWLVLTCISACVPSTSMAFTSLLYMQINMYISRTNGHKSFHKKK